MPVNSTKGMLNGHDRDHATRLSQHTLLQIKVWSLRASFKFSLVGILSSEWTEARLKQCVPCILPPFVNWPQIGPQMGRSNLKESIATLAGPRSVRHSYVRNEDQNDTRLSECQQSES